MKETEEDKDFLPPFARSWSHLYQMVIGTLVVTIALLYLFGKYYG